MQDLISRQAAIDALGTITMYKGSIPHDTAVMKIEQLPSAQPEPKWIPCSERLPEGFEPVLFTSKNGEIAIGYRDPRFKTYWACIDRADWHHTDFDVVAWMPLPESYQEGEKGGKNEHN